MPQLSALITRINSSVQSPAKTITFSTEDIYIRENPDGGCIIFKGEVLHYCAASVADTLGPDMLQATVVRVGDSQNVSSFQMGFPAGAIEEMQENSSVDGANAVIVFQGRKYYVSEELDDLVADANDDASPGDGGSVTIGGTYDTNADALAALGAGKLYKSSTLINGSPILLITI